MPSSQRLSFRHLAGMFSSQTHLKTFVMHPPSGCSFADRRGNIGHLWERIKQGRGEMAEAGYCALNNKGKRPKVFTDFTGAAKDGCGQPGHIAVKTEKQRPSDHVF